MMKNREIKRKNIGPREIANSALAVIGIWNSGEEGLEKVDELTNEKEKIASKKIK